MPPIQLLIIDNQREVRRRLRQSLSVLPVEFHVNEAASGEEALLMLRRLQVDLLVSDVRLAGMDGLELLRKARLRQPGLKAILMAAKVDEQTNRQAAAAGVEAMLGKPLDLGDFLAVVERIFGLARLLPPATPEAPVRDESEPAEEEDSFSSRLASLRQALQARTTALFDAGGQIVAQAGEPVETIWNVDLVPAWLSFWSAGANLSLALGADVPKSITYLPGQRSGIYLMPVGASLGLLVAFPPHQPAERYAKVARLLTAAVEDLLHIIARMGLPVTPDLPETAELPPLTPENEQLLDEDPVLSALFNPAAKQPASQTSANDFWEQAAQQHAPAHTGSTGSLSYDQAQRLGLGPDGGEAHTG
jgi:DNA-binding NarL/FixJ family response regulator